MGGQLAARLVSSNPAEAVSVGARGSGTQTNRERWRESAERSHSATSGVATTEKRSEEQERERSEETRLESWRLCEARRDVLKERCEENRPNFEPLSTGYLKSIRVCTCKKLETHLW
jgi:hypothetical protein